MLKKSLGQNFLQDHNILRKEVSLADVAGKIVLEIGPGDGRLTEKILDKKPKKLIVVEKDTQFIELLIETFPDVEVVEADFLEYEMPKVDVVFGNIPYYISSPIIFKLKDYQFDKAVLMVQKEFAEKMVAKPNESNYGRLSVTSQIFFKVKLIQTVPAHLFVPKPKVDSAIIVLEPTGVKLTEDQENLIRILFSQKNKTVRAALKKKMDSAKFEKFLDRRIRTLTRDDVLELLSV
ncbi:MAG: 16S rRNA (adenine(1518)-N(6)/adenine(1519)-N(6))-dimethyltransferase RsmA [Candidatus Micrarchaeota archaeon]